MDWIEQLAEERIRQAQREGLFDDLPGKGKPLPPDRFANLPPELRLAARVLANSGCVPEEVSLLKELGDARERLRAAATEADRIRRRREYCEAELRYNIARERRGRRSGGARRSLRP